MARFKEGEYAFDHGGYIVKILKVDETSGTYTIEYDDPTCEWDGKQKTHPIDRCDKAFRGQSKSTHTSAPIREDANHMHNLEPKLSFGEKLIAIGFTLFVAYMIFSFADLYYIKFYKG